jgi:hypothetical protein
MITAEANVEEAAMAAVSYQEKTEADPARRRKLPEEPTRTAH